MSALYWLLAILVFGLLIFLHELGHYLTARAFGVRINEFSIGMGPKIVTYTSKKTEIKYSIGMLPFGGYVSMLGEDEESDSPDSFSKKAAWKRLIITAAGATMNLLSGFVLMFALVLSSGPLASNVVASYPADSFFEENNLTSSATYGLQEGDRILSINGQHVHIGFDLSYEIMRTAGKPANVVVLRDGVEKELTVTFPSQMAEGMTVGIIDFYVEPDSRDFGRILTHTWYRTTGTVKMVFESFAGLLTGEYGMESVSGPIGVAGAMTDAAKTDPLQFLFLVAVITINLGIVNLFPIPALDGGRIFFILIELIFRRPVPAKYEGVVHFIGIIILFALMILILFKDIFALFA